MVARSASDSSMALIRVSACWAWQTDYCREHATPMMPFMCELWAVCGNRRLKALQQSQSNAKQSKAMQSKLSARKSFTYYTHAHVRTRTYTHAPHRKQFTDKPLDPAPPSRTPMRYNISVTVHTFLDSLWHISFFCWFSRCLCTSCDHKLYVQARVSSHNPSCDHILYLEA